jgi:DNA-directed RNA polymerase specialized sigma24 family protein
LNAGDGVNMLVAYMGWEGPDYHAPPAPSLRAVVVNAFADRHGGNRLKWLLGEVGGPQLLDLTTRAGCRIHNDYETWASAHGMADAPKRPYLMGVSREVALQVENQWITRMFTYFPPRFHFTEPQRRILVLAREGYTDAEIGAEISVSPDAVKKRWGAIYDRVEEVFPHLLPESPLGGRGAEKRRALLAHLRERPEELRPYDRRVAEAAV